MSNFVYHNWGCTSIYQLLSYPFRSLGGWTVVPLDIDWILLRLKPTTMATLNLISFAKLKGSQG